MQRNRFVGDAWSPSGVWQWDGDANVRDAQRGPLTQTLQVRAQRWGRTGFRTCLYLPTVAGSIAICADVPDGALEALAQLFGAWWDAAQRREVSGRDIVGDDELEALVPLTRRLCRVCGPITPHMVLGAPWVAEVGYDGGGGGAAPGGGFDAMAAIGAATRQLAGGGDLLGGFTRGAQSGGVTGGLMGAANSAASAVNQFFPGLGTAGMDALGGAFRNAQGGGGGLDPAIRAAKEAADREYNAQQHAGPTRVAAFGDHSDPTAGAGVTVRQAPPSAPDAPTPPPGLTEHTGATLTGSLDPRVSAPYLGAANVLGQAAQLVATSPEMFGSLAGPMGALVRASLRGVDALAAAKLGDPYAVEVVKDARRAGERKVANALRIAEAIVSQ